MNMCSVMALLVLVAQFNPSVT